MSEETGKGGVDAYETTARINAQVEEAAQDTI